VRHRVQSHFNWTLQSSLTHPVPEAAAPWQFGIYGSRLRE